MTAIVTLTMNPSVDKSAWTDRVVPEDKLRLTDPHNDAGGGGLNVSRAIRKLGGDSLAVYLSGGLSGQLLDQTLAEEGVRRHALPIRGSTRESLTVSEHTSKLQYRFNLPGPHVSEDEWQRCLDFLRALEPRPAYLVLSGSLPPGVPDDFYARTAEIVRPHGTRVVIDTSQTALVKALEVGVFLVKPNLRELAQLAGRELDDEREQEQEATRLVTSGKAEAVAVSLGAAGVLFASKEGRWRIRAPTVPIKSKVGAGDSTVAGIVLSLARGLPLLDAVRFGVATGAAAVMTPGTELCRREDAERLFPQATATG